MRDKKSLRYLIGEDAFRKVNETLRDKVKHFKSDTIKAGLQSILSDLMPFDLDRVKAFPKLDVEIKDGLKPMYTVKMKTKARKREQRSEDIRDSMDLAKFNLVKD